MKGGSFCDKRVGIDAPEATVGVFWLGERRLEAKPKLDGVEQGLAECDLVAELPGERHFGGYVLHKKSDGAARVRASRDAIGEISGN